MSRVLLIAADKPLPVCNCQETRTVHLKTNGHLNTLTVEMGFMVAEHRYYRNATDELGYSIKPYQYELSLELHEEDLSNLKSYLEEHFVPGEEVELWNVWIGDEQAGSLPHYRGRLADFDIDTLRQFLDLPSHNGDPGQCRMTVTI